MRFALALALALALARTTAAQIAHDHAVVVTRLASATTSLLDVDLTAGRIVALARFPSDALAPLAVTIDPVVADLVLAVDRAGSSRLVRLTYRGTVLLRETILTDLSGSVTAVAVADRGEIYATTGGAQGSLWRVPRRGGIPVRVASLPRAVALQGFGLGGFYAWVAQAGATSPPVDPQVSLVDLRTGQILAGPYVYAGFAPGITGVGELVTAVPRHLVTDDLGRISLSVNFQPPVPIQTAPVLPAGGTRAMRLAGYQPYVVGGQASPYVRSLANWSGTQPWQTHAGPLPGDPVDLELGTSGQPAVWFFGESCGGGAVPLMLLGNGGLPRLGNAGFTLEVSTVAPNAPLLFVLGASDERFLSLPLPLLLPGGCPLHCSADVIGATTSSSLGTAAQRLPIPASTALAGLVFFGQWLEPRLTPALTLRVSAAAAVHVYP